MARILYETIWDEGMVDSAVHRGLNRSLRALRDREIDRGEKTRDFVEYKDRDAVPINSKAKRRTRVKAHWVPYVHHCV